MLAIEDLNVYYGGIHALKGITVDVPENRIVTLVGANGAGKSSLLRAISGLVPATSGSIRFLGKELTGRPPYEIVRSGIAIA
ncbi:MAG TPA: ATP-binding cassette domain-containing protein, partial [Syntrophales bacterium]|nr:ATP-binding cassette domain-containing protein [Syntrophales bacterium]